MAAQWAPNSWRSKPALQMPNYPDQDLLQATEARLASFPRWYLQVRPAR